MDSAGYNAVNGALRGNLPGSLADIQSQLLSANPVQGAAPAQSSDPLLDAVNQASAVPIHAGSMQVQDPLMSAVDDAMNAPMRGPSAPPPAAEGSTMGQTFADVAKSFGVGAIKGVDALIGLPGDAGSLLGQGVTWAINKLAPDANRQQRMAAALQSMPLPSSADVNEAVSSPFGGFYKPKTTAGEYAQTIGSFTPAVLGGEGSLASRVLGRIVAPGVGAETAGQLTKGSPYEGYARAAGGIVAGAPSLVGSGARSLGRALSASLPESDANLVLKYEAMGGNLRPGQYNPSNIIRQGDSVLSDAPFQRAAGFTTDSATKITPAAQEDQFNSLLSKTFGEDAKRITSDVVETAKNRIGQQIGDIVSRNAIASDDPLKQSLQQMQSELDAVKPALDPTDANRIGNTIKHIETTATNGMTGKVYQGMRQRGGLLDGLSNDSNPTVANFGKQIRATLDDAFQRQAPEEDAAALDLARQQYRAVKTIEPLANKAPTGNISPGLLLGQVIKEYGNPENAGDLGTLAQVGKAFLKAQPSSGTSERGFWRALLTNPIKAAGETVALPLTVGGGRLLNSTVNSPAARARLLGNVLQESRGSNTSLLPILIGNQLRGQ